MNTAWRHLHLYGDGKERRYFFDGSAPVRWGANYPDGIPADNWSGDIVSFRVVNDKTKEAAKRTYRMLGKKTLDSNEEWTDVTDESNLDAAGWRFFKVKVEMK